jgi:hypothetical protein
MSSPMRRLHRLPATGLVLGCSGLLKLQSQVRPRRLPQESADDVQSLLSPRMSLLLGLTEIGIAILDIVLKRRRAAAILGMLIFGIGGAVISYPVARGQRAKCNCFGSFSNHELGLRDVGRNVALLALAANQAQPLGSGNVARTLWRTRNWALGPLAVLQAVAIFFLLTKFAVLRRSSQLGPKSRLIEPGAMVPHFEVVDADEGSEDIVADALRGQGSPFVLLFGNPQCDSCLTLRSQFGSYVSGTDGRDPRAAFIWISTGGSESSEFGHQDSAASSEPRSVSPDQGRHVYLDKYGAARAALGVIACPVIIVIGADGRVAEKPYLGRAAMTRWKQWTEMCS